GVVLGDDVDVTTALRVGVQALVVQPAAQGDVLRVAQLGGGHLLALEVGGGVDLWVDDQEGAARGGAGDDPHGRAVALGVGVDGRVGADEGGVDGAAEDGLDGRGAGVEDAGGQRDV